VRGEGGGAGGGAEEGGRKNHRGGVAGSGGAEGIRAGVRGGGGGEGMCDAYADHVYLAGWRRGYVDEDQQIARELSEIASGT